MIWAIQIRALTRIMIKVAPDFRSEINEEEQAGTDRRPLY
jgi:hypothetical protein